MVAAVAVTVPAVTAEITGGTSALLTVIETLPAAVLPAASVAMADTV
jgi:hypothetical protein